MVLVHFIPPKVGWLVCWCWCWCWCWCCCCCCFTIACRISAASFAIDRIKSRKEDRIPDREGSPFPTRSWSVVSASQRPTAPSSLLPVTLLRRVSFPAPPPRPLAPPSSVVLSHPAHLWIVRTLRTRPASSRIPLQVPAAPVLGCWREPIDAPTQLSRVATRKSRGVAQSKAWGKRGGL